MNRFGGRFLKPNASFGVFAVCVVFGVAVESPTSRFACRRNRKRCDGRHTIYERLDAPATQRTCVAVPTEGHVKVSQMAATAVPRRVYPASDTFHLLFAIVKLTFFINDNDDFCFSSLCLLFYILHPCEISL